MDKLNIYLIIALLLFLLGIVSFINSSFFEISQIDIINNNLLTREEVITTLGIDDNENIFYLNYHRLAQKLNNLSQVQGVKINRKLPNQLEIIINERKPLLIIKDEAQDDFMVDKSGEKLGYYEHLAGQLPEIELENYEFVNKRLKIANKSEENFTTALQILYNLDDTLLNEIAGFEFDEQITLFLSNGGEVKFNQQLDLEQAVESFSAVFSDLESRGLEVDYIDLRYGNNIAVKTK